MQMYKDQEIQILALPSYEVASGCLELHFSVLKSHPEDSI